MNKKDESNPNGAAEEEKKGGEGNEDEDDGYGEEDYDEEGRYIWGDEKKGDYEWYY